MWPWFSGEKNLGEDEESLPTIEHHPYDNAASICLLGCPRLDKGCGWDIDHKTGKRYVAESFADLPIATCSAFQPEFLT